MGLGKIIQKTSGKYETNKKQVIKGIFFICFVSIFLLFFILMVLLGTGVIKTLPKQDANLAICQ